MKLQEYLLFVRAEQQRLVQSADGLLRNDKCQDVSETNRYKQIKILEMLLGVWRGALPHGTIVSEKYKMYRRLSQALNIRRWMNCC